MSQDKCIELVSRALDAALMRQTAITNNIANASTPGYQSIQVNFEEQLNSASISDVRPFYELSGLDSSIDEQMALSVKNATQFRALIKGLNHRLAIMKLAVQGNNAS
ncbi:flagellar basal body rod protein FlgB [Legionella sp. CNM-4043-24]|uniref:flagellar basal body rod protein FlgB n=1 Tax=Legionella sp. CNM-4043-24 TaxID=3421646 RepID=UPI00403B286D